MKIEFSNHQIVTLAVYLLGGDSRYVDTEDIAIKANEIAPKRFVWKKYPDQINIENVRTFLSDAKKEKNGAFLMGSGKKGWILTGRGIQFAKRARERLDIVDLTRARLTNSDKQWLHRERTRMLSSTAYKKSQTSGINSVMLEEIKAFFRIDDYVSDRARKLKITRALNMFGDDPELGEVVRIFVSKIEE